MLNEFFNLLKKDHQEVMSMLDQMKETSKNEARKRGQLLMQLKQELFPHLRGEEKAFYPILRESEETKEDAMEAMEEHHTAELILGELGNMPAQDEFWSAKLSVFQETIRHHIEEEEDKIFADAKKVISKDQIESVLHNFQKEKEMIKQKSMAGARSR
jgi:hemerythrin-like domain-containing protein